jgi:RNA polymerase sigma-70 factor, ECF subfamily
MKAIDDSELARRCASGDEAAWREFVRRHGDLVFAVCYRVLSDRAEARDASQEALVRAVRSISKFRMGSKIKPWLSRIAWNVALRKASLRVPSTLTLAQEALSDEDAVSVFPDPLQVAEQEELKIKLKEAITALSMEERLVLELRCGQDMDYREISEATNMPIGTVKTHLFRARKRVIEEIMRQRIRDEMQ